jgi:hypothetical protein
MSYVAGKGCVGAGIPYEGPRQAGTAGASLARLNFVPSL